MKTRNDEKRVFQGFIVTDNELELTSLKTNYIRFPNQWTNVLKNLLESQGINVE